MVAVLVRSAFQTRRRRGRQAVPEARPEPVAPSALAISEPPEAERLAANELDIHLPAPSIWPVVLALGITFFLFGVVTDLLFSVLGGLVIFGSLVGWIGELRHE
jgi:cytochrome c oxidase subunit 1